MDYVLFLVFGVAIAVGLALLRRRLAEFPGQTPEDYADSLAEFDLRQHLNGKMVCDGAIFGPLGRVTSTFTADFDISWDGNVGIMAEVFRYNDGSTQNREWTITLGKDGHFTTTAEDVPGGGIGIASGMAVQMRYLIRLPESAGGHRLRTVDWMYLTPDGTIVNRSQFRKFGIKVAELTATIRPVSGSA